MVRRMPYQTYDLGLDYSPDDMFYNVLTNLMVFTWFKHVAVVDTTNTPVQADTGELTLAHSTPKRLTHAEL